MRTIASLEDHGLLYEGSNFPKWLESLHSRLSRQFPDLEIGQMTESRVFFIRRAPPRLNYRDVCDSIWWQVSPHIRSRVSAQQRGSPNRLLNALRAIAQPFRFLGLPADVRNRVYRLVLASHPSHAPLTLLKCKTGSLKSIKHTNAHDTEPSLLSTNRQVRLEALPMFYQERVVELMFMSRIKSIHALGAAEARLLQAEADPERRNRPTNAERVQSINQWAAKLMPDSTRLLRKISVQLPLLAISKPPGEDVLRFSLDLIDGKLVLNVEKHAWLSLSSQKLLSDHTAAISKVAQSLKLEGEALIIVLTSRPDIWDLLELMDT